MCSGREDSLTLGCFLCNVIGDAMTDLKEGFPIQTCVQNVCDVLVHFFNIT